MTETVKNESKVTPVVPFVELKNLTKEDVKKYPLFPVKLRRSINRSGLTTSAVLKLNELNLQISLVSSQRQANGRSTQLRYFLPDMFIALILDLGLPQVDDNKKDINEWNVNAAVRFVKGKFKQSEREYHSIEIVFKQYKYHVHFLTPPQLAILEALALQKKLIDKSGKVIKLNWIERPDAIDELDDVEEFNF